MTRLPLGVCAALLSSAGVLSAQIIYTPVGHIKVPPTVPAQGEFTHSFDVTRNGVDDFRLVWNAQTQEGPFILTLEALHPGAGIGSSDPQTTTPPQLQAGEVIGPGFAYIPAGLAYRDFGPMLPAFAGKWLPGERGYFALRIIGPTGQPHYAWAAAYITQYPSPQFVLTAFAYQSEPSTPIEAGDFCYPDCNGDGMLNINDFLCFIDEFAIALSLPHQEQIHHYANCDGNTTEPILTVNDFLCFIDEFAAGCP